MHRSATSMVTRFLAICGLYVGEASDLYPAKPDNPEGFWEHFEFHAINDRILTAFHGGWDSPPELPEGWLSDPKLDPIREEAVQLIARFQEHEHWGWKDPRNSITLPFWKQLIPDLKTLVPVRHPLDVANSLVNRGYSSLAFGLGLWQKYSEAVDAQFDQNSMMLTHQAIYFQNPGPELDRILKFCGLNATPEQRAEALATISSGLRHSKSDLGDLFRPEIDPKLILQYLTDCIRCGPNFEPILLPEIARIENQEEELHKEIEELKRKLTAEQMQSGHKNEEMARFQELLRSADARKIAEIESVHELHRENMEATRKGYEKVIEDCNAEHQFVENKLREMTQKADKLSEDLIQCDHDMQEVKNSLSWRLGSGIVRILSAPKRLFRK
jgi:hypothetical protein